MSKAYGILFALNGEPKVLNYFNDMMSDTWLYVGSDLLIAVMSERCLKEEDQHTRNLLRLCRESGVTIRLAAPVLDEVAAHLGNSDLEYRNHVRPIEPIEDYNVARQVPKILVRSYLYSKLFDVAFVPTSWEDFVGQFCNPANLRSADAEEELRRYFVAEFGFVYEPWEQVRAVCDSEQNDRLFEAVMRTKTEEVLARNDAYMYQLVRARRAKRDEDRANTEYGHQTWWLTSGEGAAVRSMTSVDGLSERVLMRPGFLAKFIQLAPSAGAARESLGEFVPSLVGIHLARRVADSDFKSMVKTVGDSDRLQDGRRSAAIASMVDQLKTASRKEYDDLFSAESSNEHLALS
jgi:hypothetical protein